MEKMNQVSVTEFMSKSKEEMYDMAVEMVNKYNRLVDICNDSAERIAEFMAKDGINEFKKELQSKAPGEFKIQKLSDIVVWADGKIRDGGYNEEKYRSDASTAYRYVKAHELWKIRDVALKSIDRHTVYTDALNNDIADKEAKIELLEKEIEGRKECYTALKELMDTKYISIDEHNNIVDPLNKEIERLNIYTANQKKVNHDLVTKVTLLESELADRNVKIRHQKENLDGINKTLETRTKEKENLINVKNSQEKEIEAHEEENKKLEKCIEELKETMMVEEYNSTAKINRLTSEIEKLKVDLIHEREKNEKLAKAHAELENDMRYTTIIEYQDIIDSLNKDIESWKHDVYEELKKNEELEDKILNLIQETDYYKNQERIRTDQLRATESKVDQLSREKEEKEKDHGRAGFEEYIRYIIAEEEGKFKGELNKRFSEEVSKISQKRTEEELAKVKLNEKYGYAGEIAFRIRSEVDKKRIVDISEGAEKILGVSRELFDAAIKALVDDGYQEIIGRIPQATSSYVYMDMHVLATPDVETRETANAENIKSLDSGIPCGEDSIE